MPHTITLAKVSNAPRGAAAFPQQPVATPNGT